VRAAIFGLTEAEVAGALGVAPDEAQALCSSLAAQGRLSRRGKRLIAAGEATASGGGLG
jgi:hypothetical protein